MSAELSQWFAAVFSHPDLPGALAIAAKTTLIYLFLVLGLRLLGKRELGQMSIYDLVLVIVIANSVQNAMVGQDTTLLGGLISAFTLLIVNRILTRLILNRPGIRHWLIGQPVLVVREGHFLNDVMQREGLTSEHVFAAMREHGLDDIALVQMAVLEIDGSISIVPQNSQVHRSQRRFRGMRVV